MPIGACLARREAAAHLTPGAHGSTFGGNPLACAAALAVIETMQQEKLDERAARIGEYLTEGLRDALAGVAAVRDIRGRGLLIGIELKQPCKPLAQAALEQGLLINVAAENVIRLAPPLIIETEQVDRLIERLAAIIKTFEAA